MPSKVLYYISDNTLFYHQCHKFRLEILEIKSQPFDILMVSSTLPWGQLSKTLWELIPDPATLGQFMVVFYDPVSQISVRNVPASVIYTIMLL